MGHQGKNPVHHETNLYTAHWKSYYRPDINVTHGDTDFVYGDIIVLPMKKHHTLYINEIQQPFVGYHENLLLCFTATLSNFTQYKSIDNENLPVC